MRKAFSYPALLAIAAMGFTGCGRTPVSASSKSVVVLGIDGMDPNFLEKHWDVLPNLNKLRQEGEFKHLETTMPPQSPVAWSTFITGLDPGGHGIYDFVHRNPQTLAPYSSMGQVSQGGRTLSIGPYDLPLSSGHAESPRHGKPFWQILSEHHVATTVIRMPTDFPPVHCADGFSVGGMGTPDLRGTFGTFQFYSDQASETSRNVPGGQIAHVELRNHSVKLRIQGPDNTLRKDKAPTFVEMTVHVDPNQPAARFDIGDEQFILKQGEWSQWIQTSFPLVPGLKSAAGMFRVYAKRLHPEFEVYVSPINIDPSDPELPVSAPDSYGRQVAKEVGLFYTQGMAQDTAAFRQGVFDYKEYIAQSRRVSEDHLKLLRYGLQHFHGGFFFFHFFGVDQDSHMLWGKYDDDLLRTYEMVDEAIGWVRKQIGPYATLMVMSDHGFSTFDRAVHLNTWLMKEGFLTLDDPKNTGDEEVFPHVDWSRTQAYAVGLNGIYLNLQGRERDGIVAPGAEADAVLTRLLQKMKEARDPESGKLMFGESAVSRRDFHGSMLDGAPDLIVGYMPGYRSSWQTALGAVPALVVVDNKDEWRADHCIDARFVPGVLISNVKSQAADPRLSDLTVSILERFGLQPGAGMIGHTIY